MQFREQLLLSIHPDYQDFVNGQSYCQGGWKMQNLNECMICYIIGVQWWDPLMVNFFNLYQLNFHLK